MRLFLAGWVENNRSFIFSFDMHYFIFRFFKYFVLPAILIAVSLVVWDPFKVFFDYEDYYTNNRISGNREAVCVELFEKREIKPTSFIIGSSRSQAFKTNYWATKISENPQTCFHYDGSDLGLYRATKAIQWIDKKSPQINNLLLVVDTDFFRETSSPQGHLFIQPYIVSGDSRISYYLSFIKASIDPFFIFNNLIYKLLRKHYGFMGRHISKSNNFSIGDNFTGDIWYGYDRDIASDSIGFYQKRNKEKVFFDRSLIKRNAEKVIGTKQLQLLREIQKIVEENNTKIKIVVSPLYNQLYFNEHDLKQLIDLFGEESLFDFSGINEITSDLKNYYESSHYKPYVANRIMDSIYTHALK